MTRSAFTASKRDTVNPNWFRVGLAFGTSAVLWGLVMTRTHSQTIQPFMLCNSVDAAQHASEELTVFSILYFSSSGNTVSMSRSTKLPKERSDACNVWVYSVITAAGINQLFVLTHCFLMWRWVLVFVLLIIHLTCRQNIEEYYSAVRKSESSQSKVISHTDGKIQGLTWRAF